MKPCLRYKSIIDGKYYGGMQDPVEKEYLPFSVILILVPRAAYNLDNRVKHSRRIIT